MVPVLHVSAPVGAPVAPGSVLPGHSTVALAGKSTKVGLVVSFTVRVCTVQTLTVKDTTKPTFVDFPANATVECPGSTEPGATGAPTGADTCSTGTISHTDTPTSGNCVDQVVKTITRHWVVTDACGNHTDQDQTITVKDTTKPTFVDFPANATVECPGSTEPGATGAPTGADTCSTGTISHTDTPTSGNCVDQVVKTITRHWRVSDACGNHTD